MVFSWGGVARLAADDKPPAEAPHAPLMLKVDTTPINRDSEMRVSYASVVKKAAPSVVYVYTTKKVRTPDASMFFNDPNFRKYFNLPNNPGNHGDGNNGNNGNNGGNDNNNNGNGQGSRRGNHPAEHEEHPLGSGIILSANGYVITNNHVVDGADEIKVKLGSGSTEYVAKLVGHDAGADVAVLKIDAEGLTAATLGDSDQLEVGDTVLAIGNPFDVGLTVTHGIVSALGRNGLGLEGKEGFENFIQTDAPINPGNSGGALVDSEGRVVGINTAIESSSQGSNGVGFAIPIDMVRSIADQLVRFGKVKRGLLGVMLQPLTPDLASQFGVTSGALISDVTPDSPADHAGFKSGDVITSLNGKPVEDYLKLRLEVSGMTPGTTVTLGYIRDGKPGTASVTLGERQQAGDENAENSDQGSNDEGVLNGVAVSDLTSDIRSELQIPPEIKGAVITDVDPDSASARAGLQKGDVIEDLNSKPVTNANQAVELSKEIKGPKVLVRLYHEGASQFVVVDESQK